MQVARVAVPPVAEKRNALPWLFLVFFSLLFLWMLKSEARFALQVLVSASILVAALESAYTGMHWCTAAFIALAVLFNPFIPVLRLNASITALAMLALSPMLLLFLCRKTGAYVRSLTKGSRWWLPWARGIVELLE
ncbi:MAG TPA: hypothetical protein VN682_17805 [Terriglobales bacterium]|nr:hypothetical protein [Terriglobales bacterium]HXF14781.1 hypothetical protein [Terriglobales bacterium]